MTPVVPSTPREGRIEKPKHQIVAELLVQALDIANIHMVLCDREFDAQLVWQVIDNLGLNFLIPKRQFTLEGQIIEQIDEHVAEVAVEHTSLQTATNGHVTEMSNMYVPSTRGENHVVFVTNRRVDADKAHGMCLRYDRRWRIENQYKSMRHQFRAQTASRDFNVRLFYFVFQCLLYNIWRTTDALLKLKLNRDIDTTPELTAGEFVDVVSDYLRPIT